VAAHSFRVEGDWNGERARRFLAEHGDVLAFELVQLKHADLAVKRVPDDERRAVRELRIALERELASPHRLGDLAVDGNDLIELGYGEGPALGRALRLLLDAVLADPAGNEREALLERAREGLR
jgi:tRNA nucleotidyltransferase (CCA-adding enzyme)